MTAPPKHNNGTHGGTPLRRMPQRVVTRDPATSSDCAPYNFRLTPTLGEVAFAAVMTWLLLNALVPVLGAQP